MRYKLFFLMSVWLIFCWKLLDCFKPRNWNWCWQNGLHYERLSWAWCSAQLWLAVSPCMNLIVRIITYMYLTRRFMANTRLIKASDGNVHICTREKVSIIPLKYVANNFKLLKNLNLCRKPWICMNSFKYVTSCLERHINTRQREQLNTCEYLANIS